VERLEVGDADPRRVPAVVRDEQRVAEPVVDGRLEPVGTRVQPAHFRVGGDGLGPVASSDGGHSGNQRGFHRGRPSTGVDLPLLEQTLREAPVVDREEYQYVVTPVTDAIPEVEPALLREMATGIAHATDLGAVDRALAPEAMGIHHAAALAIEQDLPFVVARKREYGLPGEVAVHQETAYGEDDLYLDGVDGGDRLLLVDDMLSSGGTLRAIHEACESTGAEVVDCVVVLRRADPDLPFPVTALADIDVVDGRARVIETFATRC
jgi:adenine phosphoribosyltransferase